MDWLQLGGALLGGLFGGHKQPQNPMLHMYQQYAPYYLQQQKAAFDQLAGPQALQRNVAAYSEGTGQAAQDASTAAMQQNASTGGAGSENLAANLVYNHGRDVTAYQRQAMQDQAQNAFSMAGQGLGSVTSGVNTGMGIQNQNNAMDQQKNGWWADLPRLLKSADLPRLLKSTKKKAHAPHTATNMMAT